MLRHDQRPDRVGGELKGRAVFLQAPNDVDLRLQVERMPQHDGGPSTRRPNRTGCGEPIGVVGLWRYRHQQWNAFHLEGRRVLDGAAELPRQERPFGVIVFGQNLSKLPTSIVGERRKGGDHIVIGRL